MIIGFLLSELATYKVFSSFEILIPFGLDRFFIRTLISPFGDNIYTPLKEISFNLSLSPSSNPYGGSVKKRFPLES